MSEAVDAASGALLQYNQSGPDGRHFVIESGESGYEQIARVAIEAAKPHLLELMGATVVHVQPGKELVFVTRDRLNIAQSVDYLQRLRAIFPRQTVALVPAIDEVIVQDTAQPEGPVSQ